VRRRNLLDPAKRNEKKVTAANETIACGGALPGKTINVGTGNDALNGGTGVDILKGDAGKDSLSGPPTDTSVDDVNGGADTDVCQGPGSDRDVLVACNP
jgi:Ca2+-binding RTX toxin-like protein